MLKVVKGGGVGLVLNLFIYKLYVLPKHPQILFAEKIILNDFWIKEVIKL